MNAEGELVNGLDDDLYSNGTADGGKQIDGLKLLIPDTPNTGTVGNIDRTQADNYWWRPQHFAPAAAISSANVVDALNQMKVKLRRSGPKDKGMRCVFLAGNDAYIALLAASQNILRLEAGRTANMGFQSLRYGEDEVMLGGGQGSAQEPKDIYALHPYAMKFYVHRRMNFRPIGPNPRTPVDQALRVTILGAGVCLAMTSGRDCGIIKSP